MSCPNLNTVTDSLDATTGLPATCSTRTNEQAILQHLIDYLTQALMENCLYDRFDAGGRLSGLLAHAMDLQNGVPLKKQKHENRTQLEGENLENAIVHAAYRLEQAKTGVEDADCDGWRIEPKRAKNGAIYVGLRRGSGQNREYRHVGTIKSAKQK